NAVFVDGTASQDIYSSAVYGGTSALPAARTRPGNQVTMSTYFNQYPDTMAVSALGGPNIYFNFRGVDTTPDDLFYDGGLLMHELIHKLGAFDDDTLLLDLGFSMKDIKGKKVKSEQISKALSFACF